MRRFIGDKDQESNDFRKRIKTPNSFMQKLFQGRKKKNLESDE